MTHATPFAGDHIHPMRIRDKLIDIAYRGRDLARILSPDDRYGRPDTLGRHYEDPRSYYTDFRNTAFWEWGRQDGVPVVYIPNLRRQIAFPMTIIHFGLGSLDLFFETGEELFRQQARAVMRWAQENVLPDGSYDNHFRLINASPRLRFYSNNSGMTLGQMLSFLTRVIAHDIAEPTEREPLLDLMARIQDNMIQPVKSGGAMIMHDDGPIVSEYCRSDGYVVLNGWIFGLLGLYDLSNEQITDEAREMRDQSTDVLERWTPRFIVPGTAWSFYDNQGRTASQGYQITHISQMHVMHRLTGRSTFLNTAETWEQGNTRRNRIRYMAAKIPEKVRDRHRYVTDHAWEGGLVGRVLSSMGKEVDERRLVKVSC